MNTKIDSGDFTPEKLRERMRARALEFHVRESTLAAVVRTLRELFRWK